MKISNARSQINVDYGYTFIELLAVMVVVTGMLSMMLLSLGGKINALSWTSAAMQARHLATDHAFTKREVGNSLRLPSGPIAITSLSEDGGIGAAEFSASLGARPPWAVYNGGNKLLVFSQPPKIQRAEIEKRYLYGE